MKDEKLYLIAAIVIVYYWWHKNHLTAASKLQKASTAVGGTTTGVNTVRSQGGLRTGFTRQVPRAISGQAGAGLVSAPIAGIGRANGAKRRSAGGVSSSRGRLSSAWGGVGSAGISPSWPTTQQRATGQIRVGSGKVQVPSYTVIPLTTRMAGGGGTLLNVGGGN